MRPAHRLSGADFVRATACLMVIAHHVAQRISPEALGPWGGVSIFVQMFALGVGAFFVLSGYLLARPFWTAFDAGKPMPSLRTYALRRAARIVPAFWLALTVSFVLSVFLLGATLDGTLVVRFVAGFLLVADLHWLTWFPVELDLPLWSIGTEITAYALMPLCLWVVFKLPFASGWLARLAWVGMIALVIGAQYLAITYLVPDAHQRGWEYGTIGGAKFWWPNFNPIAFYAMFAIGILAAGVQVRLAAIKSAWFDLVALTGLGLAIASIALNVPQFDAYGLANIPYAFPWFPLGVAMILVGTQGAVVLPRFTDLRPIAYVARISYGLYVWHYLLMEIVRLAWQPHYVYWDMTDVTQWALISAGVVAVAFLIATVSYTLMEEPVMRWARGLEKHPSQSAPTLSPAAG